MERINKNCEINLLIISIVLAIFIFFGAKNAQTQKHYKMGDFLLQLSIELSIILYSQKLN